VEHFIKHLVCNGKQPKNLNKAKCKTTKENEKLMNTQHTDPARERERDKWMGDRGKTVKEQTR